VGVGEFAKRWAWMESPEVSLPELPSLYHATTKSPSASTETTGSN
jgi:hypothetical protein